MGKELLDAAPMLLQVVGQAGSMVAGSQASEANIRAARAEADQAIFNAGIEEKASRRRATQILAKQRAIGAASGLDTSSGSPLEIMLDSARQAEEEALTIRMGGVMKANVAKYKGYLAGQSGTANMFGGLAGIGATLASNKSILGDLWTKATGAFGSSPASSSWASSVPAGTYTINP